MRFRPMPPAIPSELLNKFGEPVHAFGPNMRFRIKSAIVGAFVLLLGIAFFVYGSIAKLSGDARTSEYSFFYMLLGGGLMAVAAAAIIVPWRVPLNWVFVCPHGLVRTLGRNWEGVNWTDVARFLDADLSGRVATMRQCRIITKSGKEWGFLADYVVGYDQLKELLRTKVGER